MSLRPKPVSAAQQGRFLVKGPREVDSERITALETEVVSLRKLVVALQTKLAQIDVWLVQGGRIGYLPPSNSLASELAEASAA